MNQQVPIMLLNSGEVFDDTIDEPTRDTVYRVIIVRTKTVLAVNVAGTRRSFDKKHMARRADEELWNKLLATPPVKVEHPAPAATTPRVRTSRRKTG